MKRIAYVVIATATATTLACGGGNNSADNGSDRGAMSDTTSSGNMTQGSAAGSQAGGPGAPATLTGCVLAGGEAGSYVLQLADTGNASSGSSGATGSSGGSSSSGAGNWAPGQTYRLVAGNGEDFGQHLNKKVSVNGYVQSLSSAPPVGTAGSQSGASAAANAGDVGAIRAESIRTVAERCQ